MLRLTALRQNLDFRSVIIEHDDQLRQYFEEWMGRFQRDSDLTGSSFHPSASDVCVR